MKKVFWLVGFLIISMILAACSNESSSNEKPDVYKIGAIYSKTGPASPLGEPEWNATVIIRGTN